jgi:hypothetical protein
MALASLAGGRVENDEEDVSRHALCLSVDGHDESPPIDRNDKNFAPHLNFRRCDVRCTGACPTDHHTEKHG